MHFAPRHVLVPVALDEGAAIDFGRETLEAACELAQRYGAKLTLLYVAPQALPLNETPHDFTGQTYQAMVSLLNARVLHARRALDELAAAARDRGCEAESLVVTDATPVAEAICETAARIGADLIALATHGRRGVRHFVLGSVAERVAQRANMPVLVLHPEPRAA